ncbi:uncharacterized protein K02A2.6-like [Juglans microcarpa x Juglans regia]|uniref:uncharacterized protein K02A2.6-like n=1 Tax=Juglans microcarpa x Juglans regia TaxID=2249226 RepID=UPI001B7EE156|nr:uncharacterized protein K02A2.6-like [Juglans microcarpa x Juglans regia]
MLFGLKNAGATYQHLVNRLFKNKIWRNMEVYVDDLLVKSKKAEQHLDDLRETLMVLRKYKMKLNPHKCAFGVELGKFLGFMVSERGIEANPEKIRAIMDMPPPRNINEVQKLTGRITALGHFIARSTDRCLPFFGVLRKAREWDEDCSRAFDELKEYLVHPPLLSQTTPRENLTVYLAVSPNEVSSKPDTSGRMTNWAIELSEFEVEYFPRMSRKGQEADWLAKAASGQEEVPLPDHVVVQTIDIATVKIRVSAIEVLQPSEWATDILKFLQEGILPNNREEARKIRNRVARVCGNHVSGRALALRTARTGYYWPNAHKDAYEFARKCLKCQKNAPIPLCPPEKFTFVTAPWPFAQWGLDLIGPLPAGKGGAKYVVVAVDYFTKWVEAEALATITAWAITNFLWKSIICSFGIPQSLISDNGRQFDCSHYREWCSELKIKAKYSSSGHPQANGQVEATNKTLLNILKKKLGA